MVLAVQNGQLVEVSNEAAAQIFVSNASQGITQGIVAPQGGYESAVGYEAASASFTPLPAGTGLGAGAGVIGPVSPSVPSGAGGVAAIPAAAGALVPAAEAIGLPAVAGVLGTVAAAGGGILAALQALGLGEGGGLFGNNLLGGDDFTLGGVEFGGPGLAEPNANQVIKEWHVSYDWGRLQYYLVQMPRGGRKIFMYNTRTKRWKFWPWRKPHLAVIGKNMPSHKQITRLRRNLSRHATDARTILKMVRPTALRTPRRRRR